MVNQNRCFKLWAAVLAGGNGTRLQEYARERLGVTLPKQFCALHGTDTLLQRTVNRVTKLVSWERVVVTVSHASVDVAASQLSGRCTRFAVQPSNRDTTAAVFLTLLHVYKSRPDALVAVVPSDHFVSPEETFLTSVLRAATAATAPLNEGKIVLIGCPPHCRDADLGFVIPVAEHARNTPCNGIPVARVIEKPNQAECSRLVETGAYWNTFIMVGFVSAFLEAGRVTVPGILRALEKLLPVINTPGEQRASTKAFQRIPNSNFTEDVLCRIPDRLLLMPMKEPCYWIDIGRPERVEQVLRLRSGISPGCLSALQVGISGTRLT